MRLSISIRIDDENDPIIALSRPSPTLPNEGIMPEERSLFVKAQIVNWACDRH